MTAVVAVENLKKHLRITFDTDDEILADAIAVAEEIVESYVGAALDDEEAFPGGCPARLLEAVRQLAAHYYVNPEPVLIGVNAQPLPMGFMELIGPHRAWAF